MIIRRNMDLTAPVAPARYWLRIFAELVNPRLDRLRVFNLIRLDGDMLAAAVGLAHAAPHHDALMAALDGANDADLRYRLLTALRLHRTSVGDPIAQTADASLREWLRAGLESCLAAQLVTQGVVAAAVDARLFSMLAGTTWQPNEAASEATATVTNWRGLLNDSKHVDLTGGDLADVHPALQIVAAIRNRDPQLLRMNPTEWSAAIDAARSEHERELQALELPTQFSSVEEVHAREELESRLKLLDAVQLALVPLLERLPEVAFLEALQETLVALRPGVALLVIQDDALRALPTAAAELSIALASRASGAARAVRELCTVELSEHSEAVIDRQLLFRLQRKCAVIAPIVEHGRAVGALLGDEDPLTLQVLTLAVAPWLDLHARLRDRDRVVRHDMAEWVGRRAREIVHEVNNPLSIVQNYVHLLRRQLGVRDDQQALQHLNQIEQETQRAADLLQGMVATDEQWLARADDSLSLMQVATEVTRGLRSLAMSRGVELECTLSSASGAPLANVAQVRQILTNLVRNALEAVSADTGRVEVVSVGSRYRDGALFDGLAVSDNGPGLPNTLLAQMGVPTRSDKGGTHQGLGLALAHRLSRQIGAGLDCETGAGGTRFVLLLPRNQSG